MLEEITERDKGEIQRNMEGVSTIRNKIHTFYLEILKKSWKTKKEAMTYLG